MSWIKFLSFPTGTRQGKSWNAKNKLRNDIWMETFLRI